MTSLKVIYTTTDKLENIILSPAQLVFCEDDRSIRFVNSDGALMNYKSVITLGREIDRVSLAHPFPAMYWVKDTNILWKYDDDWYQITKQAKEQIVFAAQADFPAIGESDVVYMDGTTMYRYIDGEYKVVTGGGTDLSWLPI